MSGFYGEETNGLLNPLNLKKSDPFRVKPRRSIKTIQLISIGLQMT